MQKFINILKDINELIVFKHSIFALPFIFTAMITASAQVNGTAWFGWKLLILGVLCAVSARNCKFLSRQTPSSSCLSPIS